MTINPKDVLEHANDPSYLREFIDASKTQVTADINMTSVASQVLLASNLSHASSALAAAVAEVASTLSSSLGDHAKALTDSAAASERHARSLTLATWALFGATAALVLVSFMQACR